MGLALMPGQRGPGGAAARPRSGLRSCPYRSAPSTPPGTLHGRPLLHHLHPLRQAQAFWEAGHDPGNGSCSPLSRSV